MNNHQINGNKQHRLVKTKDVVKEYPILTLYALEKAVKENKIPYTRVGNTNYFDVVDIEEYITSNKRNGDD